MNVPIGRAATPARSPRMSMRGLIRCPLTNEAGLA